MPYFTADDGCQLFYTDDGQGLPLLCLAGLTRNHHDFDYMLPHLDGVRMVRMDYRGRGQSDWPGPETYTIARELQDALALLDHLDIPKTALLGTSRGGLIAMVWAQTHKDRLMGVALNDIGPELSQDGLREILAYLGRTPVAPTLEALLPAREGALTGFEDVPRARWEQDIDANFLQTETGVENRYDNRLRDAVLGGGAVPQLDLWSLFDGLDGLPLALIHGVNSTLLSADTVAEMARRRPDMIVARVAKRGHVPFLDEPESVDALNAWLEKMR